jgi:hypothetical protein
VNEVAISVRDESPLWRRIVDFPLVAMVIAIIVFVIANAADRQLAKVLPQMVPDALRVAKAVIVIALALAGYKMVIVRLGDRPRDDLEFAAAPRGLGFGLIIGFLLFCSVAGVAALLGIYKVVGQGGTQELVKDIMGMGIASAFMEELLFRGILFRWIEEFAGSWTALALTSLLFGLGHLFNPGATWASSLAIAVEAGVMLGAAYMWARSLWLPIGLHAAWNFTQGFIFDVPVSGQPVHGIVQAKLSGPLLLSGGSFGLESSIIAVVLCIPVGVAMTVLAVRRGRLVEPWWVRRRTYAERS